MITATIKRLVLLLVLFFIHFLFSENSFAQDNAIIKQLKDSLHKFKPDSLRAGAMSSISREYLGINNDSADYFAKAALELSRKAGSKFFEANSLFSLSLTLEQKNDLTNALALQMQSLDIAEKTNYPYLQAQIEFTIASTYNRMEDYTNGLKYFLKTNLLVHQKDIKYLSTVTDLSAGYTFMMVKKYDSALVYVNRAHEALMSDTSVKPNDGYFGNAYSNLGEIYTRLKKYPLAIDYLRACLDVALHNDDKSMISETYYDLATIYKETNVVDSAIYYCKKSLAMVKNMSEAEAGPNIAKDDSWLLSNIYEPINKDSAFTYLKMNHIINDSLFSRDKINQSAGITNQRQLHEQEIESEKEHDAEERKKNIEYAAIGIAVISFMMLFIFLSPSISNTKLSKFLGILALLLMFEFINLFIHPYIGRLTNESPLLMLLILVAIAAIIIPLHGKIEHWITHQLIEKNKKQQHQKMVKTIEKLQSKLKKEGEA